MLDKKRIIKYLRDVIDESNKKLSEVTNVRGKEYDAGFWHGGRSVAEKVQNTIVDGFWEKKIEDESESKIPIIPMVITHDTILIIGDQAQKMIEEEDPEIKSYTYVCKVVKDL